MGDENHIRTLGYYSKPSHEGYRNTIELPAGNNVVPLRFDTIRLAYSTVGTPDYIAPEVILEKGYSLECDCTYEVDLLPDHFNFFRVRPDATGRMSLSVIMKCTTAIRQLAYGTTPDAFDEYLQMTEYLRKPTLEDVENIYNKHLTTPGFSRMLGSIDCANNDINVLDNSSLFDDILDDKAHVAP
nr:reverse transcriptase domain-containing protein [Tanacetum cinerariifolium]